jgi:hypothetical protein
MHEVETIRYNDGIIRAHLLAAPTHIKLLYYQSN